MYLKHIQLINFKNFESKSFEFDSKINCLVGNNGVGKTNVLDAIYQLSQTKSYFNPISAQNIRHDASFYMIEGHFSIGDVEEQIVCSFKAGQKKVVKRNGKAYEKFSEHIGSIPLVIISPADRDLIIEGSETRRRFMDHVISQSDKQYLHHVIRYQKVLSQRNALLKYFAKNRIFNEDSLQVYDDQMAQYALPIFEKRKAFIEKLKPVFLKHYKKISRDTEPVDLAYKSQLHQADIASLLKESLPKDRINQYTGTGVHRDDLSFSIYEHPIRKFGSQGQQKSYLIALKLAQYDFIEKQTDRTPILLLDDIFDKLDDQRVSELIHMVNHKHFGQIFITDTHAERTENIVKSTRQSYKIFHL